MPVIAANSESTSYTFDPDYELWVMKPDPSGQNGGSQGYPISTLLSCQATLVTQGVGQFQLTCADPNRIIANYLGPNGEDYSPHAMDVIHLRLTNRWQLTAPAWTGYIDSVHTQDAPDTGQTMTITATGPYKLWEITTQTAADTFNLMQAYFTAVKGSDVLRFTAKAVGYPTDSLRIGNQADSGANSWTQPPNSAQYDPQQQTYSAIIQALLADTGLEFFFDESGFAHWRRVGYLGEIAADGSTVFPKFPRPIDRSDILHIDLAESDEGVVTYVEVRYFTGGNSITIQQAPHWLAPETMVKQLSQRRLIVYAPWVNTEQAAQYLANILGLMYSSGTLIGSVTIPADPFYIIGSIVEVPTMKNEQSTMYYYVSAISYQLTWGGAWVMTLGLSYGRPKDQLFPYNDKETYPIFTGDRTQGFINQTGGSSLVPVSPYSPNNPYQYAHQLTLVPTPSITAPSGLNKSSVVYADPTVLPVGTLIRFTDPNGNPVNGSSINGEYTVLAGKSGSGYNVLIQTTDIIGVIGFQVYGGTSLLTATTANGDTTTTSTQSSTDNNPNLPSNTNSPPPPASNVVTDPSTPFTCFPISLTDLQQETQVFGPATIQSGEPPYTYNGTNYPNFHLGVDLAAVSGKIIHAVCECVVLGATWSATINDNGPASFITVDNQSLGFCGFGYNIITQSITNPRYVIHYAHCIDKSILVDLSNGPVHAQSGQSLSQVGSTGHSTGPHLHLGVYDMKAQTFINPIKLFTADALQGFNVA